MCGTIGTKAELSPPAVCRRGLGDKKIRPQTGRMHPSYGCEKPRHFADFSHFWLATPQEVLQADWQEVWHSPQPPSFLLVARLRVFKERILFMMAMLLRDLLYTL